MNDIQKDYLIGLIIKKIEKYDLESLKEFNIEAGDYIENIKVFIEKYADDPILMHEIYNYLIGDNDEFFVGSVFIERAGLYVIVKDQDKYFVIKQADFTNLIISAKCYLQEYLPLGSVVRIKDDGNLYVIEQRMVNQKGKNYYYDYRAIPYPMGIFNEQMYVYFSSNQIEKIEFFGYSDLENEGYELALKESFIDNDIFEYLYQDTLNKE